jgi:hypothetical protein
LSWSCGDLVRPKGSAVNIPAKPGKFSVEGAQRADGLAPARRTT